MRSLMKTTAIVAVLVLLCGCAPKMMPQENTTTTTVQSTMITSLRTETTTTGSANATTVAQPTASSTTRTTKSMVGGTTVTTSKRTNVATTAASPYGIALLEPKDGFVIESQAPLIEEYMAITNDKKAAEFWVATYTGMAHSISFTARWQANGIMWRVYLAENPEFTNAKEWMVTNSWMTVDNLLPGRTYYWKVVNGSGEESEVRSVITTPTQVRWIYAEGSDNVRDMGGWKTESGKRIKYELLYRGGCIDGYKGAPLLTTAGKKVFKSDLGIRTEIDLRGSDAAMDGSPFGGEYFDLPMTQYDYIYDSDSTKKSLGEIFDVLSDESKYPIYYHCNAGADRTGTLSFIICGLLGVSHDDLTRDFELTGFSSRGQRLRSKLDTDTITFSSNGIMQNGGGNYIAWGPLYKRMMQDYGTSTGKLSDAIARFLVLECGVTEQEIDTVRGILLE